MILVRIFARLCCPTVEYSQLDSWIVGQSDSWTVRRRTVGQLDRSVDIDSFVEHVHHLWPHLLLQGIIGIGSVKKIVKGNYIQENSCCVRHFCRQENEVENSTTVSHLSHFLSQLLLFQHSISHSFFLLLPLIITTSSNPSLLLRLLPPTPPTH